MNLTQLITRTGQKLREGKPPSERLTNAEVKAVLETAIGIMREALHEEGRLEIQGFLVIERTETPVKPGGTLKPYGSAPTGRKATVRRGWRVRVKG
jgi:nucleoid DNA-binding protein